MCVLLSLCRLRSLPPQRRVTHTHTNIVGDACGFVRADRGTAPPRSRVVLGTPWVLPWRHVLRRRVGERGVRDRRDVATVCRVLDPAT